MNSISRLFRRFSPENTWPIALWLTGLLIGLWPTVSSLGRNFPGDPGDTRFCQYVLEHGYQWLIRSPGHLSFWDPGFFYPIPNMLAYSETLLGTAPLYWCWRLLSFSTGHAFALWLVALVSLNFWAFYFVLSRDFSLKRSGASLGAFLFAFASARIVQLNHPQQMPHFITVIALHALIRVFRDGLNPHQTRRWIAVFFTCCAAQLWASFYLGWFLGVTCLFAALLALVRAPSRHRLWTVLRSHALWILVCLVGTIAALAPMLIHYSQAAKQLGPRGFDYIQPWIPVPASWFYMGQKSWLYDWMTGLGPIQDLIATGTAHEHGLGLGFVTLALAFAGLLCAFGAFTQYAKPWSIRLILGLGIFWFMATTRFYPHFGLWSTLFDLLPASTAVRTISRIALLTLIPTGLAVALFIDRLKSQKLILALVAICVLEQGHVMPYYDNEVLDAEVARFTSFIDSARCKFFFFTPHFMPDAYENPAYSSRLWFNQEVRRHAAWRYQIDAMWMAMRSGVPTINGYSGNFPPGWGLYEIGLDRPEQAEGLKPSVSAWLDANHLAVKDLCWLAPEVREQ
jgi:hypothetical protein